MLLEVEKKKGESETSEGEAKSGETMFCFANFAH